MKEIREVILYSRESSRDQAGLDTGKSDMDICRDWAKGQGWKVVDEFFDKAVSGNSDFEKREQGSRAAALIKTGKIDAVVSPRIDRLTRSDKMAERGKIYDFLGEHDTAFASPNEGIIHCTDLIGDVQYSIRSAVAKEERKKIKERAKAGYIAAVRDKRSPGGTHAFGIRWIHLGKDHPNRGYWEKNEEEREVLKRFFSLVRKGYALETIADMFNEEGIKTKTGKRWRGTTLHHILYNDFYFTGVKVFKDGRKLDTDIRLFSKAQVMEARRCRELHPSTKKKKARANEAKYKLLQGLIFCECGRVLTPHSSGFYYRCKEKGCRKDGLKMKQTNDLVWDAFETKLTDPQILYDAWESENTIPSGDLKEARKQIRIADGKLREISIGKDRLVEQYTLQRITPNKYNDLIEKLEEKEAYWNKEKVRGLNSTHSSDEIQLAAEKAAQYIKDKISVLRAIREVKASLVDADMEIQLRFKPKLIELMERLGESIPSQANKSINLDDIKDMTYQLKRNILTEAHQNAIKIVSYKGGQIFFEGFLTSHQSATARNG